MLDVLNHPVAVLDGGLQAWTGAQAMGPADPMASGFAVRPWPVAASVSPGSLVEMLGNGVRLVDARAQDRYRGDAEPIDPVAGHVPGAVNAPWIDNLDPATGRFRSPAELRRRYEALGAGEGTVAMCGSGVTACHDLLAMRVAGIDRTRLFAASWSGWIVDRSRPVATGPDPG